MMKEPDINKGHIMEERLRNYFLKAGYYVIRGVPFIYEGFDITDIDLWLYGRASSVSREITIVDIKNKKTPQAIERIFWVQGLKKATKATNAIVATTDKRQEVKDFGRDLDVLVLDGIFLAKIAKVDDYLPERLQEEDFIAYIKSYSLNKIDGDWLGRVHKCKSLLSANLSFDNCNNWLLHGRFFAEQVIIKPTQKEVALRCLYLICSFVAIAIDFLLKDLSFLEQEDRKSLIKNGFTYGSKGILGITKVIDTAIGLVEQYIHDGNHISNQIRSKFYNQAELIPTDILGEYFSKIDVSKNLFSIAKELEYLSMKKEFSSHLLASIETKSFIFCLLDYWEIDRVKFSESTKS